MALAIRDTKIGDEISASPKAITQEKMNFFAHQLGLRIDYMAGPVINHHTDEEFAKSRGYPGTIAQGLHYYAFLFQMLADFFGQGWVQGGKMAVSFIQVVRPGDTLAARGAVKDKQPEGSAIRIHLDIWCENQWGEKVVVGTASGLVP